MVQTIKPIGDQGWIIYTQNESQIRELMRQIEQINPPWLIDLVPAYLSLGVFVQPDRNSLETAKMYLDSLSLEQTVEIISPPVISIPCCYEFQLDGERICQQLQLTFEEVIAEHSQTIYTVYAIGFCPGFPYMGYLSDKLSGTSRLSTPRKQVLPGSVAITGRQTSIYPLPRPGGWNLIGRTPLILVDLHKNYFPLRIGDCVQFNRIDEQEFRNLEGELLPDWRQIQATKGQ